MTLTFELDLDSVKTNRRAKYLGQRSFRSKVLVQMQTHTHRADCYSSTTVQCTQTVGGWAVTFCTIGGDWVG